MLRRNFLSFLAAVPFMGMLKADARKPVRYVKLVEVLVGDHATEAHLPLMNKNNDCFDYLSVPLKGDMKAQSIEEFLNCTEVQRHLKTYKTVPVLYVFYKQYSGRKVAVNMCLTNQQHHLFGGFHVKYEFRVYDTYTSSTNMDCGFFRDNTADLNIRGYRNPSLISDEIGCNNYTILRTTDYEY